MVKIFCVNTGTSKTFTEGTTLMDMLPAFLPETDISYPIIAAKVNNVCQGLKYRAFNSRQVEFLDYTSYAGRSVYCSSLCFLLCKAARDVFPECKVTLRRPISKGYFCAFDKGDGKSVTQEELQKIIARMRKLVDDDIPFRRHEVRTEEAIEHFRSMGYEDKVKLLTTAGDVYVNYYTLDGTADYYYEALLPSTGYLKVWELSLYREGLLLRVPDRHNPVELAPFNEQPKTFEVFSENLRWNRIMGLDNVGDVNLACQRGEAADLIKIAEALQEKKISIGKLSYEQSDMPEGFVISASVKEGETLAEKIDKVDLVISLGNPNAKVPDAETDDTSEGEEDTDTSAEEGSEENDNATSGDAVDTAEDSQVENG